VPILVFLGLSVLDLGPMYATDRQTDVRQTDVRQKHRLMPLPIRGEGITSCAGGRHKFISCAGGPALVTVTF